MNEAPVLERGQVVLLDTCVIIEAFRAKCWIAVTSHFSVETVAKCEEEVRTGNRRRPGYVEIDGAKLRAGLKKIHTVTDSERARLALALPTSYSLDDGERDLLAHKLSRPDAVLIVSADRAAVYATLKLGWRERIISLEVAARANGATPELKGQYTEKWLSSACTDWMLKTR